MKVPFEIVDNEITKMYDELISSDDESKINEIVTRIVDFLHRCGWTQEQYVSYMMGYDQLN